MGESDDYLARLERLNGGPLQHRPEQRGEVEGVRRKLRKQQKPRADAQGESGTATGLPRNASGGAKGAGQSGDSPRFAPVAHRQMPETAPRPRRATRGKVASLQEALAGVEIPSPCGGRAFLVESRPEEAFAEAAGLGRRLQQHITRDSTLRKRLCAVARREEVHPHDLLFLDIETTGLANTPLFLIGTLECRDGGLHVRQYFARDYSEESAVTSLFLQQAAGKHLLVSFNGITFDLRFIRERAAVHGVRCQLPHPHLDLLPVSRRVWGRRLPNCKLQTLEQHICGRLRDSDIPGHLIPEAYHEYVRTGDAAEMVEVIKHNVLDLVTMADLLARLPG